MTTEIEELRKRLEALEHDRPATHNGHFNYWAWVGLGVGVIVVLIGIALSVGGAK